MSNTIMEECPYCGQNRDLHVEEVWTDGEWAISQCACGDCDCFWNEEYKFVRFTDENGNEI